MRIQLSILMIVVLFVWTTSFRHQYNFILSCVVLNSKNEKIPIAGYWVSENYINSLIEKKSPKIAQENSLLIIIPEKTYDKTIIMYDFHDDFNYYTTLKINNSYEIWETQDKRLHKLEYTVNIISPNKIQIGETILIKINPLNLKDFIHNGLKEEILIQEELLFKGTYLTSNGEKVKFKNNGQLFGLSGFHYYKPINDYFDEGMQVDQVILVKSKKDIEWKDLEYYGFKYTNDTLKLYKLNCNQFDSVSQNCAVVEYGKLEYQLKKINNR
jgi:hypothetical protein